MSEPNPDPTRPRIDAHGRVSRIRVDDPERLVRAVAWVDEVYPGRDRDDAAVVQVTWGQWNELRGALGLPLQPMPARRNYKR